MSSKQSKEQYFQGLIENHRLAHGYLFVGESSIAKSNVVNSIAKNLAKQNITEKKQLKSLYQKIDNHQQSDIIHLHPDGRNIRVEQIRNLRDWFSKSALEIGFKIAVIHQAELMNPQSSNALLKILEEPTPNSYIILFALDKSQLLPTIQSRVQTINFSNTNTETMIRTLENQEILLRHAQIIAHFRSESVERWLNDYSEVNFSEWIEALNDFYRLLLKGSNDAFISIQSQQFNRYSRHQTVDAFDYLTLLNYNSLMKLMQTDSKTFHSDLIDTIFNDIQPDFEQIFQINKYLVDSYKYLDANVSIQLVFERLAIKLSRW